MAIKFSPGPCGCCFEYLVVFGPSPDAAGYLYNITDSAGHSFGPLIGGGAVGAIDAYATDPILAVQVHNNVFTPNTLGLPLPLTASASPGMFLPQGVLTLQASAVVGISGYVYSRTFTVYQLSGHSGAWTILSSASKSGTATSPGAISVTFTINGDGSVGP